MAKVAGLNDQKKKIIIWKITFNYVVYYIFN